MGHVYPMGSGDPVDIVAWWAEQARGPRGLVIVKADEEPDDEAE